MTDFISAIQAYQQASQRIRAPLEGTESPATAGSPVPSFMNMVTSALDKTVTASKSAELQSKKAVANEVEMHELVAAVTNADLAVQTVVAVRDRVINAYQEILRMPI